MLLRSIKTGPLSARHLLLSVNELRKLWEGGEVCGRDLAAGVNLVAENDRPRDRLLAQHVHQRVRLRPPKTLTGYTF